MKLSWPNLRYWSDVCMEGLRKPWKPAWSVLTFRSGVSHTVLTEDVVTLTDGANFKIVLKWYNVKEKKGEGNQDRMDTQKEQSNEEEVSS